MVEHNWTSQMPNKFPISLFHFHLEPQVTWFEEYVPGKVKARKRGRSAWQMQYRTATVNRIQQQNQLITQIEQEK